MRPVYALDTMFHQEQRKNQVLGSSDRGKNSERILENQQSSLFFTFTTLFLHHQKLNASKVTENIS